MNDGCWESVWIKNLRFVVCCVVDVEEEREEDE